MRLISFTFVAVALALACGPMRGAGDESKKEKTTADALIGTWKLVSARYGGRDFKFPEGTTMLKHVTPTQFLWVTYDQDGKVFRSAGGYYTLKGDQYAETPEYGSGGDLDGLKGKTHTFTVKVEGNQWHQDGALVDGTTINEVWERLEKKPRKDN